MSSYEVTLSSVISVDGGIHCSNCLWKIQSIFCVVSSWISSTSWDFLFSFSSGNWFTHRNLGYSPIHTLLIFAPVTDLNNGNERKRYNSMCMRSRVENQLVPSLLRSVTYRHNTFLIRDSKTSQICRLYLWVDDIKDDKYYWLIAYCLHLFYSAL